MGQQLLSFDKRSQMFRWKHGPVVVGKTWNNNDTHLTMLSFDRTDKCLH